jgi:hypothetical protein
MRLVISIKLFNNINIFPHNNKDSLKGRIVYYSALIVWILILNKKKDLAGVRSEEKAHSLKAPVHGIFSTFGAISPHQARNSS